MKRGIGGRIAVLAAAAAAVVALGAGSAEAGRLHPDKRTEAPGRSATCPYSPQLVRNEPGLCASQPARVSAAAEASTTDGGGAPIGMLAGIAASGLMLVLAIGAVARTARHAAAAQGG